MSESGQKQPSQRCSAYVRFTPENGLISWHSDESAMCHNRKSNPLIVTLRFTVNA